MKVVSARVTWFYWWFCRLVQRKFDFGWFLFCWLVVRDLDLMDGFECFIGRREERGWLISLRKTTLIGCRK